MHKRKYTPLYTIIVFLYGLLVKLLFFMKIEGRENVPKDRNCILMGNHQCLLDPVTLALCVPDREIHFMGKKELFENKALGWVFRQVHGFPVDRGNMDMGAGIVCVNGECLHKRLCRAVLVSGTQRAVFDTVYTICKAYPGRNAGRDYPFRIYAW